MNEEPTFAAFDSRQEAVAFVAGLIEGSLRRALNDKARASLLLSGGSTPGPVFQQLSQSMLDWARVDVGLVDERWVEPDDPHSNAGLITKTLLQGPASAARLHLMKTADATPFEGVNGVATVYDDFAAEADIILLGMGGDGHTASWFPGAVGLDEAMNPEAVSTVAGIDATGAPVAGDMPHRMTITARAMAGARFAILFITGAEKRAVLEDRAANLPIHHAELILGSRLKEVWAP